MFSISPFLSFSLSLSLCSGALGFSIRGMGNNTPQLNRNLTRGSQLPSHITPTTGVPSMSLHTPPSPSRCVIPRRCFALISLFLKVHLPSPATFVGESGHDYKSAGWFLNRRPVYTHIQTRRPCGSGDCVTHGGVLLFYVSLMHTKAGTRTCSYAALSLSLSLSPLRRGTLPMNSRNMLNHSQVGQGIGMTGRTNSMGSSGLGSPNRSSPSIICMPKQQPARQPFTINRYCSVCVCMQKSCVNDVFCVRQLCQQRLRVL